jgi:hypothetical protein
MTNKNCLNCEKVLIDEFCSGCGQKSDTHRITFKNFVFHDVLHGTFHIEKGIIFTAKQALTRPGKAALDYISGKRKPYYNVFYLVLIVFGLILFLGHLFEEIELFFGGELEPERTYINEASRKLTRIFDHSKIIIFLFVPFAALNSFILFRRKKLNLSEHAILSGMILLGMLLISLIGNIAYYTNFIIEFNPTFSAIFSWTVTALIIIHVGYGYLNAFKKDYSKMGIACRILLFFIMLAFEILVLLFIAIGFVTNWKFGLININPFG